MTSEHPAHADGGKALISPPPSSFSVLYADGDLNFRALVLAESAPMGRQILMTAGRDPSDGYSLFAILPNGDFEDVLLDEPCDLSNRGAHRFIAFLTDRDFKLTLNGGQISWGKPAITAAILYNLANASEDQAVFLVGHDDHRRLIELGELVDLTAPGVEHFITDDLTFEILVNSRPRMVTGRKVTFAQIVSLAFPGAQASNVVFSMTYRHAASAPHAGELAAGGVVEIKQGTIFNVTRTVQS
jgi:hypothetical protein